MTNNLKFLSDCQETLRAYIEFDNFVRQQIMFGRYTGNIQSQGIYTIETSIKLVDATLASVEESLSEAANFKAHLNDVKAKMLTLYKEEKLKQQQ
jgi:hypothetical protein